MNKLLTGFVLFASTAGFVMAGGDPAAGKEKAAGCVACHGQDGNSAAPTFPKLAGQNERYLLKQLKNIQCGFLSAQEQKTQKCTARSVPTMAGQLDSFDEADFADIAAYFANQSGSTGQAKADLAKKGEEIYRAGIRTKDVAACSGCHSPTGQGNTLAGFPALGGQHADYIATQLKAFRAAADGLSGRENDGDTKVMRAIAGSMSDSEIEAVASYISGLHAK